MSEIITQIKADIFHCPCHIDIDKILRYLNSFGLISAASVLLFVSTLSLILYISEIHVPYQVALAFPQSPSPHSPSSLQSISSSGDNSQSSSSTGNIISLISVDVEETNENTGFLTYESSDLGITIQYPSSWSFFEDKGEDDIIRGVTFVSMPDLTNIALHRLSYTGPENLEDIPLDQVARMLFDQDKQTDPSAMLVGQIPLPNRNIPNIESVFFQWTGQQDGVPINHAENLIKHNNELFEVEYLTLPGKYEQLYPTFFYMLNTLEFIGDIEKEDEENDAN